MAHGGIFLRAENRDCVFLDAFLEARKPFEKNRGSRQPVVEDMAGGIVKFGTFGAAAEFAAQIQVFEAGFGEGLLELLAIELRGIIRVRIGANVQKDFNGVGFEKIQKALNGMVGVADGEDNRT